MKVWLLDDKHFPTGYANGATEKDRSLLPLCLRAFFVDFYKEDSNENVAIQLNNILFGVPQISILLTDDTEEHKNVLKNYISYWKANQELLMFGDFNVSGIDSNYTFAIAENEDKKIIVLYVNSIVKCNGKCFDIINASYSENLIIESERYRLAYSYDCLGKLVDKFEIHEGLNKVVFSLGGRVEIR